MKGKLLATDSRWNFLEMSCDERTVRERNGGLEKSRFAPLNYYLSADKRNLNKYSDRKYTLNIRMKRYLTQ
jgi:hypothetical protein